MRAAVLLLLLSCQVAPVAAPVLPCVEPASSTHPKAAALQQVLTDMHVAGFPGVAAFARTREGVWAGAAGFSDLERQTPMQSCTASRAGSATKLFTALLVLKLADRSLLDLDDPLSKFIAGPTLEGIANADRVTIRQALSHTTGIPVPLDEPGFALETLYERPTRVKSTLEVLNAIRGRPASFAPGEGWQYSNPNFELLGLVIEQVTGLSYGEALEREVLQPLALHDTTFGSSSGVTHGFIDLHGDGTLIDSSAWAMGTQSPAGGVVSNVFDLARVLEVAAREPRLQAFHDVPMKAAVAPGHTGYGLGLMRWHTPGGDFIGHGGLLFGWQAWVFTRPEADVSWVLLTNAALGKSSSDFHPFQRRAAEVLLE